MNLWVRSQDKRTFAKVNEFNIGECNIIWVREDNDRSWTFLGEYKTKERCLEILDEIQKLIFETENTLIVYQMPEK